MLKGYYTNQNTNQITILINNGYSYNIKIKRTKKNNTESLSKIYIEKLKIPSTNFTINAIIKEFRTYDLNIEWEILVHRYIKLKQLNYKLYNPIYIIKNSKLPLLIFKNIGIDLTKTYIRFIQISILDRIKMVINLFKEIVLLGNNNIIHNDIKPQNVVLTDDNQLVLIDFGNAYIIEEHLDNTEDIALITTPYCSSIFYTIEGIQNNKFLMVEHLQSKACLYILIFILSYEQHFGYVMHVKSVYNLEIEQYRDIGDNNYCYLLETFIPNMLYDINIYISLLPKDIKKIIIECAEKIFMSQYCDYDITKLYGISNLIYDLEKINI